MGSSNRPLWRVRWAIRPALGRRCLSRRSRPRRSTSGAVHWWSANAHCLEQVVHSLDAATALAVRSVGEPNDGVYGPGVLDVLNLANVSSNIRAGELSAEAGAAAMAYVLRALDLARAGQAAGIVTAPINKEATQLAGYKDMGHMELFGRMLNAPDQATMLVSGKLRTVHLSTHYSLREALDRITRERVLSRIQLTDHHFRAWGLAQPRIAVSAINPMAAREAIWDARKSRRSARQSKRLASPGSQRRGHSGRFGVRAGYAG